MAKTAGQLFEVFAARVAEILRERHQLDAGPLLRVRRDDFTLEGLTQGMPHGSPAWFRMQATPEQLEWEGPDAMAEVFVREYVAALTAASGRVSWPGTP